MRGISLDYTAYDKQPLTVEDLERANRIIAIKEAEHRPLMRLYFPDWVNRVEYWSSNGMERLGTLARLERLVDDLITELARELSNSPRVSS